MIRSGQKYTRGLCRINASFSNRKKASARKSEALCLCNPHQPPNAAPHPLIIAIYVPPPLAPRYPPWYPL